MAEFEQKEREKWAKGAIQHISPLDVPPLLNLLREYVYYHKVDYEKGCMNVDVYDRGVLKEQEFVKILDKYVFPFTKDELSELVFMCPRNYDGLIQYKAFFNAIKRLGKPKSLLSVPKLLGQKYDFYEKYRTICAENFFALKKLYDFRKYDLKLLNLELLVQGNVNQNDIENFNNMVILENFMVKFSRDFLKTVKMVNPNKEKVTEDMIFRAFGLKVFEKDNFLNP